MALVSNNQEEKHPRAKFPPVLNSIDFIGEVKEDDGLCYSRNLGCSSLLGGSPIFLFGDTYIFEPPPLSRFLGIASSTASMGSFSDALSTHYPSSAKENKEHERHRIPHFIPFTNEEKQYNLSAPGSLEQPSNRFYLWICSPVIEIPSKPGVGVVWFTKGKTNDNFPENDSYYGIGIAEVEMKQVDVNDGEFGEMMPVATRHGDVIFDSSNPQWGNVATLLDNGYIYLYGTYHEVHLRRRRHLRKKAGNNITGFVENPVFLCRVPHTDKAYLFPERYTYWNGESFVAAPIYLESQPISGVCQTKGLNLEPVIYNIQCATLFYTKLFSRKEKGLFVLIGCNNSGDGKVRFKIAENPWGPWRGEGWLIDLETESRGNEGVKSCIYAHLWASDLEKGEIILTWAEPWPGGIEMARVGFEMVGDDEEEEDKEEQSICSDDSMFSDVEQRLFKGTHGKPVHKVQVVEDCIEPTVDEFARREARRKTLAKLSGHPDCDYQDQTFPEQSDYGSAFSRDVFGDSISKYDVLKNKSTSNLLTGFGDIDRKKSTKYKEDNNREEGGVRRLTNQLRGTWYLEPVALANEKCEKGETGGRVRYAENSWYVDNEDEEEGGFEGFPGTQTPGTRDSVTHKNTAQRYSFYHSGDLRVMNPGLDGGQVSNNITLSELATQTIINTPTNHLHNPTYSDTVTTFSLGADLISPVSLRQPIREYYQHQEYQPEYRSGTEPLITRPDKRIESRALTKGGRGGYEVGGYVTNLNNEGPPTCYFSQSWTDEALERGEHQQVPREFDRQIPLKPMRKLFLGKALKGGLQRMLWTKEGETARAVPMPKGQKGLKKQFSEINLRWAGKSMTDFHKRLGKSEVNLQRFSNE